jgi:hypothetical protein
VDCITNTYGSNLRQAQWAVLRPARDCPADDPSAEEDQAPTAQDLPRTWEEIAPGHLVIARESFECGWWEAVVIERSGDLLTLKHRDYPSIPNFVRHRSAVALIGAPAP